MRFLQTPSMKSGGVHKITPLAEKLLATDSCWRERKRKKKEGGERRYRKVRAGREEEREAQRLKYSSW